MEFEPGALAQRADHVICDFCVDPQTQLVPAAHVQRRDERDGAQIPASIIAELVAKALRYTRPLDVGQDLRPRRLSCASSSIPRDRARPGSGSKRTDIPTGTQ